MAVKLPDTIYVADYFLSYNDLYSKKKRPHKKPFLIFVDIMFNRSMWSGNYFA